MALFDDDVVDAVIQDDVDDLITRIIALRSNAVKLRQCFITDSHANDAIAIFTTLFLSLKVRLTCSMHLSIYIDYRLTVDMHIYYN